DELMTTIDLYRNIHKAIRAELFAITTSAARIDPTDPIAREALADHVRDVAALLVSHADHEDTHIQPVLERELPDLAARIAVEHPALEGELDGLVELAAGGDVATLHLALACFTGRYLLHQDVEERVVMPALAAAIGPDAVLAIHVAIVSSIPPAEMGRSLAIMLPAMNVDDRTEILGGMKATAPAEVFDGVWSLARSVLDPGDLDAVARRLGLEVAA
ncbi:MAG TPA: hemerythrin domain-containing protein, partial [Acidimicrobiales bacterium]|nr:hemerythrin domain-containing protein [Acidimicrobiales bacterium]